MMKPSSLKSVLPLIFLIAVLVTGLYAKNKINDSGNGNHTPPTIPADSVKKSPVLNLTGDHKKEEKNPVLTKLKIDVKIIGRIATTTMDMTFLNENDRILEGELIFPLGEGETVSRFALEVNGNLREAVVVDKNKGQQVYEELIRQKVDPGLVEQVQGNSYKVRVYPLPAKRTKRLIIAYEQELPVSGNEQNYYLPLNYGQVINDFALHIDVEQQKVKKNSDGVILDYKELENKTIADMQEKNFKADNFLSFAIEENTSTKVYIEASGDKKYFYVPLNIASADRPKKLPASIAMFWDASGSGASRDLNKELILLKSYFSKFNSLRLTVIPFANKVLEEKQFTVSANNFTELEHYLKSMVYDGATQLNALDFNKYNADEIILMSDGLSDFGKPSTQNSAAPIYTITSSQRSDFDLLKYLSLSSGGNFINLNTASTESALLKLMNEPLRIISINYANDKSTNGFSEIFPIQGSIIGDGFSICGIAASTLSEIHIIYGYGNEKAGEQKININPAKAENYEGIIKRIWAQKKLQQLMLQTEKNKEAIINCALENKIVTPYTSLLVLDRLEDYLKYHITPPSEFKASYDSTTTAAGKEEAKTNSAQIEKVVTMFKERKQWWDKDFTVEQKRLNKLDSVEQVHNTYNEVHSENYSRGAARARSAPVAQSGNHNREDNSSDNYYNTTDYVVGNAAGATSQRSMTEENIIDYRTYQIVTDNKPKSNETQKVISNLTLWEPDAPYMKDLKSASSENLYATYIGLKKQYGLSPSFYLDIADYFIKQNQMEKALRIMSNLAEIEIKNYRLLRVLAHKLEQTGNITDAIELYKQVLELRKEEPQSYRDLGLALAKNNQSQEAIEILYKVVQQNWAGRFPEIEVIVMGEINDIIASSSKKSNTSFIDTRLTAAMPMDARVILNWDADNCDIDLWVTDPRGEKCFYSNRNTKIGGRNSADFTGGYGPEEFIIKHALKGKYKVEINYYGTREQTVLGPTTIQVEMYTNYGKPNVKLNEVTRRLEAKKDTIEIGTFVVE